MTLLSSPDPDVTGGDGIYSRYLPALRGAAGRYELTVAIDDNASGAQAAVSSLGRLWDAEEEPCCGSAINYDHVRTLPTFQRQKVYGVIDIVSAEEAEDVIPPNRILDLRALVDNATREVSLRWTAPGDDFDWGRATAYEAVLATSWEEATAFEGQRVVGLPQPVMQGLEQSLLLPVETFDATLFLTVRGVDAHENRGDLSNVVSVFVPSPPTSPSPATPSDVLLDADAAGHNMSPVRVAAIDIENIAIIAGGVGGLLLVLLILVVVCYLHRSRRRPAKPKDQLPTAVGKSLVIAPQQPPTPTGDRDVSRDSVDSAVKEKAQYLQDVEAPMPALSPMQSWGASKLLQEHEQRFPDTTANGHVMHYGNYHEAYPDVALSNACSYPPSQVSEGSEPPAYQPPFPAAAGDVYYPYHQPYCEDLPPYSPGFYSTQSLQGSTVFTHEPMQSTNVSESSYNSQAYMGPIEAPLYAHEYPEEHLRKVPPPVAPKPSLAARSAALAASTHLPEHMRRNITQV